MIRNEESAHNFKTKVGKYFASLEDLILKVKIEIYGTFNINKAFANRKKIRTKKKPL